MKEPKVIQEWFFYILECRDDSLYCGIAIDLNARLKKHNDGTGSAYTAAHRPVTLVYFEKFDNGSEARKREAQVKRWPREKKIRLISGFPRLRSEQMNHFIFSTQIVENFLNQMMNTTPKSPITK